MSHWDRTARGSSGARCHVVSSASFRSPSQVHVRSPALCVVHDRPRPRPGAAPRAHRPPDSPGAKPPGAIGDALRHPGADPHAARRGVGLRAGREHPRRGDRGPTAPAEDRSRSRPAGGARDRPGRRLRPPTAEPTHEPGARAGRLLRSGGRAGGLASGAGRGASGDGDRPRRHRQVPPGAAGRDRGPRARGVVLSTHRGAHRVRPRARGGAPARAGPARRRRGRGGRGGRGAARSRPDAPGAGRGRRGARALPPPGGAVDRRLSRGGGPGHLEAAHGRRGRAAARAGTPDPRRRRRPLRGPRDRTGAAVDRRRAPLPGRRRGLRAAGAGSRLRAGAGQGRPRAPWPSPPTS